MGKRIDVIPVDALESLERHDWPGNVRELKNVLEKAVILSNSGKLMLADSMNMPWAAEANGACLPKTSSPRANHRVERLEDVEREHILEVMEQTYWRVEGEY